MTDSGDEMDQPIFEMDQPIFAVVTGGGTAGHVLPALAIADALVGRGHRPSSIVYVGAERGMERRLLPATAYAAVYLDVVGFQRRLTRAAVRINLGFVPKLWRARREMVSLMRKRRPRVVVSVGGYASLPAVLAARRLAIPVVVVSYDRAPGRASRMTARFATACAVSFPDSPLPRAHLTGAPVRQALLTLDRASQQMSARRSLEIPENRFVVAVVGGSQGSAVLNEAVADLVRSFADDGGLALVHLAGERYLSQISAMGSRDDRLWYRALGYLDDMSLLYAAADLVIARAGASTVHELAVTGTPAVLVPWPQAADDHQRANARWLSDDGAAVLLEESELAGLGDLIMRLRKDPVSLGEIAVRARARGEIHRSGALAGLVESVALA